MCNVCFTCWAILQIAWEKQFEKLFCMLGSFANCPEKQFEKLFCMLGNFANCLEKTTQMQSPQALVANLSV